jgi:hypothetical protein
MTASLECVSQHSKELMSSVNPPPIPQVESFIYPDNCSVSNVVVRHVEELVCSSRLTAKIVPI